MRIIFKRPRPTRELREEAALRWAPWFAWRPCQCLDGSWVWLERVERISYMAREIPGAARHGVLGWCYRVVGCSTE